MAGKYVIRTSGGGFKFDLKAANGEIILNSEIYTSLEACKKGIDSVRRDAQNAHIEDQTVEGFIHQKNPKFELYLDETGEYRFKLNADNGHVIGSSERYKAKAGCSNGIESVKKNSPDAAVIEPKE